MQLIPLGPEPLVLICHAKHRLGASAGVQLEDLAGERFALLPSSFGSSAMLSHLFGAAGPERRVEVPDVAAVGLVVEQGSALAILPTSYVPWGQHLREVPIVDAPPFTTSLAVPANRPLSSVATGLAQTILRRAARPAVLEHG